MCNVPRGWLARKNVPRGWSARNKPDFEDGGCRPRFSHRPPGRREGASAEVGTFSIYAIGKEKTDPGNFPRVWFSLLVACRLSVMVKTLARGY